MIRKNIAKYILIGAACMLSICGCGAGNGAANGNVGTDWPDAEIVGADWRTWGIIDAFGTLELDGEKIDVCACLYADRAELYYDEENQNLFKTVEFPERLSAAEYEKLSIEFTDDTGDGNTDLIFVVGTENTVERRFSYIYDQSEFVYDAFSAFPNPANVDQGGVELDDAEQGYADFTGRYTEAPTGRCLIEITAESEDSYTITVNWANSASEEVVWAITGATYGEAGDELVYSDALCYIRTYDEEGNYTDEDIYSDGSGKFWMTDAGMLGWMSDNSDADGLTGEDLFERID
ncbi:MAG: hypothetical protein K5871_09170 [Lachnospiraceae bacterium]|nr:hypothetical protein [Lachnospiraceae bacterium]